MITELTVLVFCVLQLSFSHRHGGYCHDKDCGIHEPEWMANLRDDVPFTRLTIPGTHDSMSTYSLFDIGLCGISHDKVSTQTMTLRKQLYSGIRALDVRLGMDWKRIHGSLFGGVCLLRVFHGKCHLNYDFKKDVMDVVEDFLHENPTEFVLIRVNKDGPAEYSLGKGMHANYYATLWGTMMKYEASDLLWSDWENPGSYATPSVGELRGKILILRDSSGIPSAIGVPYNYCDKCIQDDFNFFTNWDMNWKYGRIFEGFRRPSQYEENNLYINYLSASGGSMPYFVASGHSSSGTSGGRLWTGMLDWFGNHEEYPYYPIINGGLYFEGTNEVTVDYLQQDWAKESRFGVIYIDFPGGELISTIFSRQRKEYYGHPALSSTSWDIIMFTGVNSPYWIYPFLFLACISFVFIILKIIRNIQRASRFFS